jgi:predicted DNA-binding protein
MVYASYITDLKGIMVRTQIYLTAEEQQALRALSRRTGTSQSELIRQAIDSLLAGEEALDRAALLRQARGLWRDRDDLPDFAELRREMDRTGTDAA